MKAKTSGARLEVGPECDAEPQEGGGERRGRRVAEDVVERPHAVRVIGGHRAP